MTSKRKRGKEFHFTAPPGEAKWCKILRRMAEDDAANRRMPNPFNPLPHVPLVSRLTRRQFQTLVQMAKGLCVGEIAANSGKTTKAIEHQRNLLYKSLRIDGQPYNREAMLTRIACAAELCD